MKDTLNLDGIRNIIFDLGGVLLDLDFNAPVKAFERLIIKGTLLDFQIAIQHPLIIDFELGKITATEFRDRFRENLGNPMLSDNDFDNAWCSILLSIPEEKVILLEQLGARYRLFLYSNTNEIHIGVIKTQFESQYGFSLEDLFEKCFYSHLLHERKPMISGFEKVVAEAGITIEETLFIDDFEHNIAAAREFGFQTIHVKTGVDLETQFLK